VAITTHDDVCYKLRVVYERKNMDYGDSFTASCDEHGIVAAIVRMDDKMRRVKSLHRNGESAVIGESMRDSLLDLANYAIMSVMWLDNATD
jgi:uncharacterized protein (UPF0218 family)